MDNVSHAAERTSSAAEEFTKASGELNAAAQGLDTELARFKSSLNAA